MRDTRGMPTAEERPVTLDGGGGRGRGNVGEWYISQNCALKTITAWCGMFGHVETNV